MNSTNPPLVPKILYSSCIAQNRPQRAFYIYILARTIFDCYESSMQLDDSKASTVWHSAYRGLHASNPASLMYGTDI